MADWFTRRAYEKYKSRSISLKMLLIKALKLAWHFLSLWDYLCFINITTQTFSDRLCFSLVISSKNLCPESNVHQDLEISCQGLGDRKSLDRREELPNYNKISKHGIHCAPNYTIYFCSVFGPHVPYRWTFLVLIWARLISVVLDLCFKRKYIKYHHGENQLILLLLLSNWKCII